jgi:putative oxidoreductase
MRSLTVTGKSLLGLSILLLRLALGGILFGAGAGKAFGWFGGSGLEATIRGFAEQLAIPALLAYLSIYTELIGGALLAVGLLTRPAALAIAINMLVATVVMWPHGFFAGGAAYPFTLLVSSLAILLSGPMQYSVDARVLYRGPLIPDCNPADSALPPL